MHDRYIVNYLSWENGAIKVRIIDLETNKEVNRTITAEQMYIILTGSANMEEKI